MRLLRDDVAATLTALCGKVSAKMARGDPAGEERIVRHAYTQVVRRDSSSRKVTPRTYHQLHAILAKVKHAQSTKHNESCGDGK